MRRKDELVFASAGAENATHDWARKASAENAVLERRDQEFHRREG